MIYWSGGFTDNELCKPYLFEQHYTGTVTASSEQSGFTAVSASNELTYERWRPTALPATWVLDCGAAKSVNYCGIAAHTLTGKTVVLESSTDNAVWTTQLSANPTDNSPIVLMLVATVTARYWRIRVVANTNSTIPSVGAVFFGNYLQLPLGIEVGIAPLSLSRRTTYSGNISEGGNWLGRSIKRTGKTGSLPLKGIPRDWYMNNLDPTLLRVRYKPFFVAACPLTMPWEIAYAWLKDDPKPTATAGMLMDVTLNLEAHGHE